MRSGRAWLLVGLLAVACAVNPVTGRRELMLVSEAQEIEIGRSNDEQVIAAYGLYDDPELAAWVDRIGQRMAAASERPELPWTFRVVDDTAVNAFALPGGFIYLTRGILAHMNTEAEVVGVLGHEIGHVTARHSAGRMSQASLAQVGLGVGQILSPEVRALGGVLETGVGLLLLKFSRDDESQADELGVGYAVEAGYDPRRLASFFRTIERLSGDAGGRLPTWLSTHPNPANRVERVLAQAEPLVAGRTDLAVGHDEHLRRVDGLVFGPNPREGVMVGNTFKHPDLLFQIDYPEGWRVNNGKAAVVAAPEQGDVAIVLQAASRGEASLRDYVNGVLRGREASSMRADTTEVAGSPAIVAEYEMVVEGTGRLRVRDVWVDYGNLVYELLGYARSQDFGRYRSPIGSWQASFRPLPSAEADGFRPDRLEIFSARRGGDFSALVGAPTPAADLQTLALINGLEPGTRIDAGVLLKRVVPGYGR